MSNALKKRTRKSRTASLALAPCSAGIAKQQPAGSLALPPCSHLSASDTPKTDKAELHQRNTNGFCGECVPATFARSLETELGELRFDKQDAERIREAAESALNDLHECLHGRFDEVLVERAHAKLVAVL